LAAIPVTPRNAGADYLLHKRIVGAEYQVRLRSLGTRETQKTAGIMPAKVRCALYREVRPFIVHLRYYSQSRHTRITLFLLQTKSSSMQLWKEAKKLVLVADLTLLFARTGACWKKYF